MSDLLNLEIQDITVPLWVPGVQLAAGILIPMMAAAVPLMRGSKISVRTALDTFGASLAKTENIARFLARTGILSDTYRLALRNTFRSWSRLVLTMVLLAFGGATFMTALNVSKAWDINLKRIYTQRLYDQEIYLKDRIDPTPLVGLIQNMKGVKTIEGCDLSTTAIIDESGYKVTGTYPDKGHGSFTMLALPATTSLINPTVVEGRWLTKEGADEVVLNQLARKSAMKIGDEIALSLEGKTHTLENNRIYGRCRRFRHSLYIP